MKGKRRLAMIGVGAAACMGLALGGPALGGQGFPGSGLRPLQEEPEEFRVFGQPGKHDFVVPEDVCEMGVGAVGAHGGDGFARDQEGDQEAGLGAGGGGVVGLMEVIPGETLEIRVGGQGGPGGDGEAGDGGFNGGGDGGDSTFGDGGGGGGGASDVRVDPFFLGDRVFVGGGGGGGGGVLAAGVSAGDGNGGGGGGLSGEEGEDGVGSGEGGGGGTQAAGGAGGAGDLEGDPGTEGSGGGGGEGDTEGDPGGGGGGGGLFGGGGGGGSDGDGAGGGGGGSGFGPPDSVFFTAAELEQFDLGPDGLVFLEFTPDPGCHVEPARPVAAEPRLTG